MARKILGNDPFLRGAAPRPAPLLEAPTLRAVPPAKGPARRAARAGAIPDTLPGALAAAIAQPARGQPAPARVEVEPAVRPVAPRKPLPPSTAELVARDFLETTGAKLRGLMERRLPALIEGIAKSSVEALGLAAQPVSVADVDAFGMSPDFVRRWQPPLARVLNNYFRAEVLGLTRLPRQGPAILVCNHSGVLPYDELLLAVAVREGDPAHDVPGRELRPLSEDFAINAPFAGSWLNRFGLVRASQDNAERLLREGTLVAAFPEGAQGIGKLYRHRYQLQRFGRGGFVRLALRTGVPIYPVTLVGGEESQPVMARVRLPRQLRLSHLPVTPTFPLLGPLGLIPYPARWIVHVGEAIVLPTASRTSKDAEDRTLVGELTEQIREQMQATLNKLVAQRTSLFF